MERKFPVSEFWFLLSHLAGCYKSCCCHYRTAWKLGWERTEKKDRKIPGDFLYSLWALLIIFPAPWARLLLDASIFAPQCSVLDFRLHWVEIGRYWRKKNGKLVKLVNWQKHHWFSFILNSPSIYLLLLNFLSPHIASPWILFRFIVMLRWWKWWNVLIPCYLEWGTYDSFKYLKDLLWCLVLYFW